FYLRSTPSLYSIRRFRRPSFPVRLCRRSVRVLTRLEFLELLVPACRLRGFNSTRRRRRSSRGTIPSSSKWGATCLFASPMWVLTVTTTSSTLMPIPFHSRLATTRPAARAVVFAPQFHRVSRCYRHVDRGFRLLARYRRERDIFPQGRGPI